MSLQSAVAKDPWSWRVDDLVAKVCYSASIFHAAGCRPDDLPNTAVLEAQLRDQEVTGATFLQALDSNALRFELGIQNLGQRRALLLVIEYLRQQSIGYKQHAATTGVQALQINKEHAPVPAHISEALVRPATLDASGRKRQKTTHVTTVPLSISGQAPSTTYALSGALQAQPTIDGSGQWDYLLRWAQADERVLSIEDLAADEEDEDELEAEGVEDRSGSGEPLEEVSELSDPAADVADVQGRSRLSRDEIVEIINEQIDHYTSAWRPNHGVIKGDEVNYDPEAMWQETEASNQRQDLIRTYELDVAYYRHRLDKLCDEILRSPGNTADGVRYQCRNLEVTINSIEMSEWLLSIYSLEPVDSGDEDEEQSLPSHQSIPEQESAIPGYLAQPATALRTQPNLEVIDLGSPPESSQSDMEGVLVDSSPPPELPIGERHSSPLDVIHTPDSVIAETIEPPASSFAQSTMLALTTSRSRGQFGDEPQNASIASARRWKWSDLVDTQDRKRIVTKALHEMKADDREIIRDRLRTIGKAEMIREIPACIRMLAKNETKMPGVLPRDMPKIITFTRLFLCWWLCDNYFRAEPSKWHLEELGQCLQEGLPDPSIFCDYLNIVMTTTFSPQALRHPEQPSQAEVIEISDDDEPPPRPAATQPRTQTQRTQASQHPATIIID